MTPTGLIDTCWDAAGVAPDNGGGPELTDREAWLGGPLAVDDLAVGAVSTALLAAAALAHARGLERPAVALSGEHAALSFRSEAHARVGGQPAGAGFAPLSRIVRCADGRWARTHGNYPHHAAALERALAVDLSAGDAHAAAALEKAAASIEAFALEDAVFAEGGCATAMRSPAEWAEHPAGKAAIESELVGWERGRGAVGSQIGQLPPANDPAQPASGIRVLDLTRVIAGPVAGRTLAALGADVLRIDPPHLPELPAQHLDTGPGKRSAFLDLSDADRREALLAGADVVLTGYRPGALERFGLQPADLAERHPHLVQVSLSAWGPTGPWATRRGFDSLVQVAAGIAAECAAPDGTPGVLPAQALDHATGHLMAAAALRGLAARSRGEAISSARLSLARTAAELLAAARPAEPDSEHTGNADSDRYRVAFDHISLIAPPGTLNGVPLRWKHGPRPLGADAPTWNAPAPQPPRH